MAVMIPRAGIKSSVRGMLAKKGKGRNPLDSYWPYLKDKRDFADELRRPFERQWLLNISFLAGKQHVFYNTATELLQTYIIQKGRRPMIDNKMLPRFQKQVSRLIRNNPRMSVVPASTDNEDIKAAKKGDKVLKWYWRQHEMRKKIRLLGGWIYSTGNGFVSDRWNPKLGPVTIGKDGKLYYQGDVDVDIWTPFDIGVPAVGLQSNRLDQFPWITMTQFRDLDWIRANYSRGKEVEAEEVPIPYADSAVLFNNYGGAIASKVPGARVTIFKAKPSEEYPKGLYLVGANGRIFEKKDYPYESYHLESFKDIEIPGVFWGMATAEPAVHLQKLWNRTLGDIAEFNRVMARGKWLVPRNSRMEVEPDDIHGQKLLYTPVMGHKPEIMTLKGLPASYQQVLVTLMNSFMELYHQHEVTQGTNKSDIRSGEMVALLLEQDDFGNVPTHAVFEESLERLMSRVLRRIQQGYKTERVISITGRDEEYEVMAFKGADLKNNTDVHVIKESSLPDSKVARQYRIMENYEKGLYGSPEDPKTRKRVLQMLDEVPDDIKDIFAEDNLDRQVAKVENDTMSKHPEIDYLVNAYDNHEVHLEEHRMFQKQPEFQRLKLQNPDQFLVLTKTFMKHEAQHHKYLAEQRDAAMKEAAQMQDLMKGGK